MMVWAVQKLLNFPWSLPAGIHAIKLKPSRTLLDTKDFPCPVSCRKRLQCPILSPSSKEQTQSVSNQESERMRKQRTGSWATVQLVQSLSRVRLFATPWAAVHHASLSITNSRSLLKLLSIELVMPSNHLILCRPLLLSIFPSIRVFSSESVLRIRWPKYWSFSFNISPSNEHSGLVGSPCSPRGSQQSSLTPQFKSINFLALSVLYSPILTSMHDYWKNDSFDQMDLC